MDLYTAPKLSFSQRYPHKAEVQTSHLGTRTRVGLKWVGSVTLGSFLPSSVSGDLLSPAFSFNFSAPPPFMSSQNYSSALGEQCIEACPPSPPWHRALWPGLGIWRERSKPLEWVHAYSRWSSGSGGWWPLVTGGGGAGGTVPTEPFSVAWPWLSSLVPVSFGSCVLAKSDSAGFLLILWTTWSLSNNFFLLNRVNFKCQKPRPLTGTASVPARLRKPTPGLTREKERWKMGEAE